MSSRTRDRTRNPKWIKNTHTLNMPQDHGLTCFLYILYTSMFVKKCKQVDALILNIFTSQNVIMMQPDRLHFRLCLSQIKRVKADKGELSLIDPDLGPTLKWLTNLTVGISKIVERITVI